MQNFLKLIGISELVYGRFRLVLNKNVTICINKWTNFSSPYVDSNIFVPNELDNYSLFINMELSLNRNPIKLKILIK